MYSKIIDMKSESKSANPITRAQHVYEKLGFRKTAVHYNSWKNQLGEMESSVDYELTADEFCNLK